MHPIEPPTASAPPPPDVAMLRRRLVGWYRRHRRDLPWRRKRDPYHIWIAEIMLQQTRVDVVVPYHTRFVTRYPDVASLARAPLDAVLQAWAGLGYYARARNLRAAARRIVAEHGGRFPAGPGAVEALPGVGRYTAGAIRSIAFGQPAPILDGNVARVVARLLALDGDLAAPSVRQRIWAWAAAWACCRAPGEANQALMELGALLCTRQAPGCDRCPLAAHCAARQGGRERELPRPRVRAASDRVRLQAALVRSGDRLLLVRRRSGRLLCDWWELPTSEVGGRLPAAARRGSRSARAGATQPLSEALHSRLGLQVGPLRHLARVQHSILSHRIEAAVLVAPPSSAARRSTRHAGPAAPTRPPAPACRGQMRGERVPRPQVTPAPARTPLANLELEDLETRWASREDCRRLPLSTLARKALGAAAARDAAWSAFLPAAQERATPRGRNGERAAPRGER